MHTHSLDLFISQLVLTHVLYFCPHRNYQLIISLNEAAGSEEVVGAGRHGLIWIKKPQAEERQRREESDFKISPSEPPVVQRLSAPTRDK